MRERAEGAQSFAFFSGSSGGAQSQWSAVSDDDLTWLTVESHRAASQADSDGSHYASWHPAVALAVADLLDSLAVRAEAIYDTHISQDFTEAIVMDNLTGYPEALTMARAYLRKSS
jgi:hypothetical protein